MEFKISFEFVEEEGKAMRKAHVLAADGLDDILWRGSEELGDDGELVDVY